MEEPEHKSGIARVSEPNASHMVIRLLRRSLRAGTLPFWCLCFLGGGIAGVLVDLDHIPYYLLGAGRISLPLNVFRMGPGGFLHSYVFLGGCALFACAGGSLLGMVLKDLRCVIKLKRNMRVHEDCGEINRDTESRKNSQCKSVPFFKD